MKKLITLLALALVLPLTGCLGSKSLILDFNGRTVEYKKLNSMRFPRGIEMTSFDGKTMQLNGRETLTVNGQDLYVDDGEITFGDHKTTINENQRLIIGDDGWEVITMSGASSNSSGSLSRN